MSLKPRPCWNKHTWRLRCRNYKDEPSEWKPQRLDQNKKQWCGSLSKLETQHCSCFVFLLYLCSFTAASSRLTPHTCRWNPQDNLRKQMHFWNKNKNTKVEMFSEREPRWEPTGWVWMVKLHILWTRRQQRWVRRNFHWTRPHPVSLCNFTFILNWQSPAHWWYCLFPWSSWQRPA